MIDGIFSGLFGGFFGPMIARWLSRFKYWKIFFSAALLSQALVVTVLLIRLGFEKTIKIFANGIDPVLLLVPVGAGVIAVAIAFVGWLGAPQESSGNSIRD